MRLITAPNNERIIKTRNNTQNLVFIAGGISDCPDWQSEFISHFSGYSDSLVMFNPRRKDFDITNSDIAREQIEWEYSRIDESNVMMFWFPEETLCPITLYELGVATREIDYLFVGCHPNYKRKFDVITQLGLVRPDVDVVFTIEDLVGQFKYQLGEY